MIDWTYAQAMREGARAYLIAVLQEGSSTADAARLAGVNRTHFHALLKRYDVKASRAQVQSEVIAPRIPMYVHAMGCLWRV